jgi:tRNA 2-thiocytidine biosynthesis protein TtcA
MPAKLVSDDGKHVVIRPLAYAREDDLAAHAQARGFPIIPCNLCGSQENLQRKVVCEMLWEWERRYPGRIESIARALSDVKLSHLLDRKLFNFADLRPTGVVQPEGDRAFDPEELGEPRFAEEEA